MSKEVEIKNSLYFNMKNRNEKQKRTVTEWINNQSNATNSLITLIEHMIDRYGYSDITSFEVAKKMHLEKLVFDDANRPHTLFPVQGITETPIVHNNPQSQQHQELSSISKPVPESPKSNKVEEDQQKENHSAKENPDTSSQEDFPGIDLDNF